MCIKERTYMPFMMRFISINKDDNIHKSSEMEEQTNMNTFRVSELNINAY